MSVSTVCFGSGLLEQTSILKIHRHPPRQDHAESEDEEDRSRLRNGNVFFHVCMQAETQEQQSEQDEDKRFGALQVDLVANDVKLGCADQRVGEKHRTGEKSDDSPGKGNAGRRIEEHQKSRTHGDRREYDLFG